MGPWKKVQQRGKKVQKVGAALCNPCHSSTSETQSGCSLKRAAEHLTQRIIFLSNRFYWQNENICTSGSI